MNNSDGTRYSDVVKLSMNVETTINEGKDKFVHQNFINGGYLTSIIAPLLILLFFHVTLEWISFTLGTIYLSFVIYISRRRYKKIQSQKSAIAAYLKLREQNIETNARLS
ncbi:MAG: hypothetical protein INQ03_25165 [Candidatus Heimdallarchaeota archaeon]|nr:hypothetical protein [Candidatus Heimdallarchaeota archaeon]